MKRKRIDWSQRGSILVLFTIALILLLLITGLTVDLGVAYVTTSRLSKAVDAGALAGARNTALTDDQMTQTILDVAEANYGYVSEDSSKAQYTVDIETPAVDTIRVTVSGQTQSPRYFTKLLGKQVIDIARVAEATRYPLDMSLVLDLSLSLERNGAFDDMQNAANNFLAYFDDDIDRFGIVTYSTWGEDKMPLQKHFISPGQTLISGLSAISDTNIDEGLRLAKKQLDDATPRETSLKIVVLFTDGRPTAFSDQFRLDGPNSDCAIASDDPGGSPHTNIDSDNDGVPDCYESVVATYISGSSTRGLFLKTTGQKVLGFNPPITNPILASNLSTSTSTKMPLRLPGGQSVNGSNIRQMGADQAEAWGNTLRQAGYTVFTIGLGNPAATDPGDVPDQDFLERVANVAGMVSSSQPQGEMLFAPSPAELDAAFAKLADRILTRLTR